MRPRAAWAAALLSGACAAPPPVIEAFDATAAGYTAATGGFTVGVNDAAEGCALVGDPVAAPAGDAHLLVIEAATDLDPACPATTLPFAPYCGPDRRLEDAACATYRKVQGGAPVDEAAAIGGELVVSRGDGICTFAVDALFSDQQRVTYTFSVVDRGAFPRCEVP